MKKFILSTVAFLLMTVGAIAQNNGGGRPRFDLTEMNNRQAERLAKQMKLDDDKAEAFKVLYLDYQNARQNAANPKGEKENDDKVDFKKLTDEQATELIQKQFTTQEAQLNVDKEYLPKFLEILTPAQAAQVYVRRMGMSGNMRQGGQGRPGGFPGGGPGGGGGFPGGFGGGF